MNQVATLEERRITPSQQFRIELDKMSDQFIAALPSHIKPEKFQRVVMTAVISDPAVLRADRKSLMEAAIRAAQDGLLPDKREGAFVVFGNIVQWMPMVGGIIKRVHQSGDIKMLTARVVYGGDHFRTWIDDTGEHIEYEPAEDQDTSIIRRVFAMATTTDGAVYVEPLSAKDVEKIRNVSRSKNKGPWADWWEEMAKKSAIRRLAKRLPLSVDIHDLIQRDNAMFDLAQDAEPRLSVSDRLKAARNITSEHQDEREGFDASFVQPETESALTGEILPNTTESGSSVPSPEPVTAEDVPLASAASDSLSPELSDALPSENDRLIKYAGDILRLAATNGISLDALRVVDKEWAAEIKKMSEQGVARARAISDSSRAVFNDPARLDGILDHYAEMLECSVEEIGGAA
ncbi:hypothetical protein A6U86_05660 [Rhizobium sp. AC27/96]|uniref:recombinase RecT n=1 Tax=Rhizobium sp. AC27/96 TaxID=1841653 RepID=UPI000828060A|nr:recombinase RecT [Rhizobium sp. AC27/96]OCJ12509.1 hypothetical protein A6U86_05660 [Rhizobium sp. AC27/96]